MTYTSEMSYCPTNQQYQYSQSRSQQTIATFFRYSLTDLLKNTLDGSPHFIRCFKPNDMKQSNNLIKEKLKNQIVCSGILEAIQTRKIGYPIRLTFVEFLKRYCFLGFNFDERVVATRENCQVNFFKIKIY